MIFVLFTCKIPYLSNINHMIINSNIMKYNTQYNYQNSYTVLEEYHQKHIKCKVFVRLFKKYMFYLGKTRWQNRVRTHSNRELLTRIKRRGDITENRRGQVNGRGAMGD